VRRFTHDNRAFDLEPRFVVGFRHGEDADAGLVPNDVLRRPVVLLPIVVLLIKPLVPSARLGISLRQHASFGRH
jgi:hypothetical protein